MQTENNLAATSVEPAGNCAECSAAYVSDQRYCLECGATLPAAAAETTLQLPVIPAGPAGGGPAAPVLAGPSIVGAPSMALAVPAAATPGGTPPGSPPLPPSSPSSSGGSAPTVIAGVGVLLLALGVGVLIGRSTVNTPAANTKPQIINVGGATGSTSTNEEEATTGTGSESSAKPEKAATKTSKSSTNATGKSESKLGTAAKKKESEEALTHLKEKGGKENYEQKSNKLPNVVETP